ncbi:unnamed protein product, partial [marine sediment metagenome]
MSIQMIGGDVENTGYKRRKLLNSFQLETTYLCYNYFPGSHNLENILSAIAIASLYRLEREAVREALLEFKGL